MKVLKSWLLEYLKFDWSDSEISDKLSSSGTLVESYQSKVDSKIIIVQIIDIKKHHNADNLKIVKVFDGKNNFDIVCGASNIAIGQKVPFATIGAKISDTIIEKANIRGFDSCGMLCSEHELGIGNDLSGIMILNPDWDLGASLSNYVNSDTVFDLEITPNRGDCLSHFGIVREIGALLGKNIKKTPIELKMVNETSDSSLTLDVKAENLCPNYYARVIKNITVGPSPEWLKARLELCGINSINNVVDITNYIMLDLGQPLHAFDLKKIAKETIIVRVAKKSETIETIDHDKKILSGGELIIADSDRPIAIAGLMGGSDSEISNQTRDIVIEAAEFDRKSIRSTSKQLSLTSEASYRFERGIDSGTIEYAINKAAKMISEIAGGSILSGIVKKETKLPIKEFKFDFNDINNLLGTSLKKTEIDQILRLLGFKITENICSVPIYRHDVSIWPDLAEEVVRIYGINKIKKIPIKAGIAQKKSSYYFNEYVKDVLIDLGFSELYSYSFMSEEDLNAAKISPKDLIEIKNPIQPENKYLRNSLIPGLLKAVSKNPTFDPITAFEVGNIFSKKNEFTYLGVVVSGKSSFDIINNVEKILTQKLNLKAKISIKELARDELQRFKIKKPLTYVFEFNLSDLSKKSILPEKELQLKLPKHKINYRPLSKYPSLTRDLAFITDKEIISSNVSDSIYEVSDLINRVELFDEFTSDKIGKNKKNIAFHIYLQSPSETLKDSVANKIITNIITTIEDKFKAKLRF